MRFYIKYHYRIVKEGLTMWVAWHLPRYLVMWCYIRVVAHASTGQFDDTNFHNLSIVTALKRWDQPDNV